MGRPRLPPRPCTIEGCDGIRKTRGMCYAHYFRFLRYGDPSAGGTLKGAPMKWLKEHVAYESNDCLKWPFADDGHGYGQIVCGGKPGKAHIVMCRLAHGEPPTPKHQACHSCGKGDQGCVNPRHVRWATATENMADRVAHGTSNRGGQNGQAKLTEADVSAIRQRYKAGGVLMREIAAEHNVTRQTINDVIGHRRWRWVND